MAAPGDGGCINAVLTDDELRAVLGRLGPGAERDAFGLVCRRWLRIQSSERRLLRARAGPAMLRRLAARFPGVRELDLSQSPARSFYPGVTDDDLDVIATGFRDLRVLALQNCKGRSEHHLCEAHKALQLAKVLRLAAKRAAGAAPPPIRQERAWPHLLKHWKSDSITDAGVAKLGDGLQSLQSLDVSHCRKVSDKGLRAVALGCQSLRQLHISGCRLVTDDLLRALSKSCSHLEDLGLAGCSSITDAGISALADGCRCIKSLDLSKCNKVGDPGICRITEASSSCLVSLKLLDCNKVSDRSIFSLAKFCHDLETLVVSGCCNVGDESVESLALACGSSLRSLRMDWCLKITDSSLRCLLSNCKLLVALDVGCCDQITDAAFQALQTSGFESELRVLKVSNCVRLTVLGVSIVLETCKALEYLDIRSCPQSTRQRCEEAGLQFPDGCRVNFEGGLFVSDGAIDKFF